MKRRLYTSPQKKLAIFNQILESVNELGAPIIVEGKRDQIALKKLGFNPPIMKLNDGKSVLSTVEGLLSTLPVSREFVIFTDWDRTGRVLAKQLQKYGESIDLIPNISFWNSFISLFSKDITCIEELPTAISLLEKAS